MALRDPLPMGLGSCKDNVPKFNPMQVNQVFNECLAKEFRHQGPVQRRDYRFNIPTLKTNNVAKRPNLRTKEAVREQLSKGCNSPRMIRDLQSELGKRTVTPMTTPPGKTQAATLCYKSVKDHLQEDGLRTGDPQSGKIQSTLQLQRMLPPERRRLPETMAQDVGWLASGFARRHRPGPGLGGRSMSLPLRGGQGGVFGPDERGLGERPGEAPKVAYDTPNFFWKPRRPCAETEYVRLYYETVQSNPFSNAGMFPDAKDKTS